MQGAGRCARGPNDYAVVVVLGSDITKYFSRPDNLKELEPELQAEVEFGWQNSKGANPDEVIANVEMFLAHDVDWREQGEPMVTEFRQDAVKVESPAADALGKSAALEVEAWQLVFSGDWTGASEKLQQAVPHVGPEATRGYRGLLLYIAGLWLYLGAQDETQRARARQLVREAALAANRGTWLKEMRDLPGVEEVPLVPVDVVAVNAIVARLRGQLRTKQVTAALTEMLEALGQDDAKVYERGLTALGSFLGAEASKPKGQGRCDSAWVWGTAMWMTVEAKSEEHDDGLLPLKDVRQANTQLDQLAADRGMDHPPAGSPAIIVSDRLTVDPQHAPAANPNVYLTSTDVVAGIASDVSAVWGDLLTTATGIPSGQVQRQHVRSAPGLDEGAARGGLQLGLRGRQNADDLSLGQLEEALRLRAPHLVPRHLPRRRHPQRHRRGADRGRQPADHDDHMPPDGKKVKPGCARDVLGFVAGIGAGVRAARR